jgi:hypothetical protein
MNIVLEHLKHCTIKFQNFIIWNFELQTKKIFSHTLNTWYSLIKTLSHLKLCTINLEIKSFILYVQNFVVVNPKLWIHW